MRSSGGLAVRESHPPLAWDASELLPRQDHQHDVAGAVITAAPAVASGAAVARAEGSGAGRAHSAPGGVLWPYCARVLQDVERARWIVRVFNDLWMIPLRFGVALALVVHVLGAVSALAGLGAIVVLVPITRTFIRKLRTFQKRASGRRCAEADHSPSHPQRSATGVWTALFTC
jgi:hypothetical protein